VCWQLWTDIHWLLRLALPPEAIAPKLLLSALALKDDVCACVHEREVDIVCVCVCVCSDFGLPAVYVAEGSQPFTLFSVLILQKKSGVQNIGQKKKGLLLLLLFLILRWRSCYVVQAGLKFEILLPQSPEC
jgi:hypothetical protein